MNPYYQDEQTTIYNGDCREILQTLPDDSVDAVVTDPPYGLAFMGKRWDYDVPSIEVWAECLRILKPGGHLLAFAGTRTQHRMAVKIEDAGFEIRDMIAWVYGSGFPKSLDVSKAIDAKMTTGGSSMRQLRQRAMGSDYEPHRLAGTGAFGAGRGGGFGADESRDRSKDKEIATPEAKQWNGWGTALKPALEPITVARKPLCGTVAENVLQYGTGGINVDGCRVGTESTTTIRSGNAPSGRWPANLIHDGSEEVTGLFPETGPAKQGARGGSNPNPMDWGNGRADGDTVKGHDDSGGSAARFFYTAKADKADRGHGNNHPTVKPQALMRYLVRLVCQPGGVVLDPFGGRGTTAAAARLEHCRSVLCELSAEYCDIAVERLRQRVLF